MRPEKRIPVIEPLNTATVWEHTPLDYYRYGLYPRFIRPPRPPSAPWRWESEVRGASRLVAFLLLLWATAAHAAVTVRVVPTTQTAVVSDTVTVEIRADVSTAATCGGAVFLQFDPAVMVFADGANNTATWDDFGRNAEPVAPASDYVALNVGKNVPVLASDVLVSTLHFTALAVGTTSATPVFFAGTQETQFYASDCTTTVTTMRVSGSVEVRATDDTPRMRCVDSTPTPGPTDIIVCATITPSPSPTTTPTPLRCPYDFDDNTGNLGKTCLFLGSYNADDACVNQTVPLTATFGGNGNQVSIIFGTEPQMTWRGHAISESMAQLDKLQVSTFRTVPATALAHLVSLGASLTVTPQGRPPIDLCAFGRGCTRDESCDFSLYEGAYVQVIDAHHPPPTQAAQPHVHLEQ